MNPLTGLASRHRRRRRLKTLLILSFLATSLLLFNSTGDVTNATQQKPASNPQATSTPAPATQKFTVTVTSERGGFIVGLKRDSFAVFEGKSEREINYFNSTIMPASVGILVDVSASMRTRMIEAARSAVTGFIERSLAENEYFISEFDDRARELTDWTRDRQKIMAALNSLAKEGGGSAGKKSKPRALTALYDTCIAALEKMSQGTHPKRVVLIISDAGGDNASKHDFGDLKNKIRESDVLIYGIGMSERLEDVFGVGEVAQTIFDELTTISGGRAYFPILERKELDAVVERIAMELQHQYVIGFTPTNAARSGKWNKVKVKMSPAQEEFKKLTVRSRDGYLSPPASP